MAKRRRKRLTALIENAGYGCRRETPPPLLCELPLSPRLLPLLPLLPVLPVLPPRSPLPDEPLDERGEAPRSGALSREPPARMPRLPSSSPRAGSSRGTAWREPGAESLMPGL